MKRTNRKTVKKYNMLRRCLLAAVSFFIGINVYHWNAATIVGNSLPMPFGIGAAVVLSGSMEPALSVDDLIFVAESDSYEVGEIVVYQQGQELIVHRLIELNGETMVTKGDANNVADRPVEISDIKGKVVAALPFVGAVVLRLKTPAAIIVVFVVAFLLMELSYRKARKEDDRELEEIKEEIRKLQEM